MFDKFNNRLTITATLVCVTGIHIGAGEDAFEPTESTGSIVRNSQGAPYIPGSSLKGVLRAFLSSIDDGYEESEESLKKVTKKGGRKELGEGKELAKKVEEMSSITHRLFGSQVAAGKIKLSDATPQDGTHSEFRKGNAIERDTHTAVRGALFDTEVTPAESKFSFRLDAENLSSEEADMLLKLIDYFAEGGIRVGGRSRAGLGEIKLVGIEYNLLAREGDGFPERELLDRDKLKEWFDRNAKGEEAELCSKN